MESIELVILWAFSTYIIGNFVIAVLDGYKRVAAQVRQELVDHLDEVIHIVEKEVRGDIQYWFDKDSGQFLAQGSCADEVINTIKKRFPEHSFYLVEDNQEHILCEGTDWKMVKIDVARHLKKSV